MPKRKPQPVTGQVIARRSTRFGEELITAAVTLPATEWDELTAGLKSAARDAFGDRGVQELALDTRIDLFLDLRTLEWAARCRSSRASNFDSDLDGGVAF